MSNYPARSHERVVIRDDRGEPSWQKANLGPNDFNADRLQSGPTVA
jgi:hypothetical protein